MQFASMVGAHHPEQSRGTDLGVEGLIAFSGSKVIVAIEAQKTVESPELLIT